MIGNMNMTTGQLIKSWRISEGLTQTALASLLSVSPQSVRYWEADIKRPSNAHCDALQRVSRKKLKRDALAFG